MPAPPTLARLSACAEVIANGGHIPGSFLGSSSASPFAVSAADHGAVGDGTTDDSAAINAALAACGRGQSVVLDCKPYRCASPINLPDQVSLVGQWPGMATASIQESLTLANRKVAGTVLLCDWAASSPSDTSAAFLTVGSDGTIAGLNVYDLRQGTTAAGFVSRPWMIGETSADATTGQSPASSCTIRNVNLINPYRGIRIWGNQRFLITDTILSPLKVGLWVDQITDTSTVRNTHVVPIGWFSDQGNYPSDIESYIESNLTAYRFDRCDAVMVSDSMVYSAQTGLYLGQSAVATNPRVPWILASNFAIDVCDVCVDAQSTAQQGCFFSNGTLTTNNTGSSRIAVRAGSGCGDLGFANVSVCSQAGNEVRQSGGRLAFTGCYFYSFGNATTGSSASIRSTGGDVVASACTFEDARPPISWQQSGGTCRTAATNNRGGQANIDPNSRINAGGNA